MYWESFWENLFVKKKDKNDNIWLAISQDYIRAINKSLNIKDDNSK